MSVSTKNARKSDRSCARRMSCGAQHTQEVRSLCVCVRASQEPCMESESSLKDEQSSKGRG